MSEKDTFVFFGPVKREAGESPARTRRCKRGAFFQNKTTGIILKFREGEKMCGYSSQKTCLLCIYCETTGNWLVCDISG